MARATRPVPGGLLGRPDINGPNRLRQCDAALREALEEARLADCPALVKKIQSARKSLGGAARHMQHRLMRNA